MRKFALKEHDNDTLTWAEAQQRASIVRVALHDYAVRMMKAAVVSTQRGDDWRDIETQINEARTAKGMLADLDCGELIAVPKDE